jgi:hypothetical protein
MFNMHVINEMLAEGRISILVAELLRYAS